MDHQTNPKVRVLDAADSAVPLLLEEVRKVMPAAERSSDGGAGERPLISLATGGTFTAFFRTRAPEVRVVRHSRRSVVPLLSLSLRLPFKHQI